MTRDAYICDAVRTPIGRYGGVLAAVRTDDLGAVPIRALMQRNSSALSTAARTRPGKTIAMSRG